MTNTIRIVRGRAETKVFSPFEAKDLIKGMPTRHWNKTEKCWVIPSTDVPLLHMSLQGAGFTTWIVDDPADSTGQRGDARTSTADTWADRMFAELEPPLADKAFKALIRVLHPDTGGSTTAMKALNSARDMARIGR